MTRRVLTLAIASLLFLPVPVWAGSPHFVNVTVTQDGSTLTVSGKEAGLGNETQVHITLTATANCINPGGHHPKAANKTSVAAEGDFPVQNGQALFAFAVQADFQPDCSPPMSVSFTDIEVCDAAHNICRSF